MQRVMEHSSVALPPTSGFSAGETRRPRLRCEEAIKESPSHVAEVGIDGTQEHTSAGRDLNPHFI